MIGACWQDGPDKLALVLELASRGSLATFFKQDTEGTWAEPRYGFALGVAKCMKYLHHELSKPLIHRDLKPENVLITEDLTAKVADFGESRRFDEAKMKKDGHDDMTMTIVG